MRCLDQIWRRLDYRLLQGRWLAWSADLSGSWPRPWGSVAILPLNTSAIAASSLSGAVRLRPRSLDKISLQVTRS